MKKRKPCGYYWRLKKALREKYHDEDTLNLSQYSEKQQRYIVHMAFKHLPKIKIVLN